MLVPKLRFKEFTNEWAEYVFGDLVEIKNGLNKEKEFFGKGTPIINYMDVNKKETITSVKGKVTLSAKEINNFRVKKGDIFFTRTSETAEEIGLSSSLVTDINDCVFSGFVLKATPLNNNISPDFSGYYFRTNSMRKEIIKHSSITTRALTSGTLLKQLNLRLPSIKEQEKIGKLFTLLDKLIELQQRKIEALKLYKLYSFNTLFKNTLGEETSLKEILKKWNKKNIDNEYQYVESVSNKYGFISQSEQFEDRNVASLDKSNYYIIEENVFAYNPSRLNVGSLALKDNNKISLVSPLYECFTTSINNKFLLEWFSSTIFKRETYSRFEGGVRNTLTFNNLVTIPIRLPNMETQKYLANFFVQYKKHTGINHEYIQKLNLLKKGLLQQMFI